jgi:Ca2+-dependent lipid-binding protein
MLNIMDLPLISQFVQSSVDAAMAEYVAPKSISLDLKDMLAGDDFKKDTVSRGVVVITIVRGYDFKCGDAGIPLIKEATSDPYISVGWAKFGKALWSTRLLMNEMNPVWQETAYLLVTPEELNVNERLRLQLWDSDRFTADDDLGRIEVDLKHLMKSEQTNGKMYKRCDGFRALKKGEDMPGKLDWNVGYFSKTRIQDCQLQQQTYDPEVRTMAQLKDSVDKACEKKLREAFIKGDDMSRDDKELEQQKAQELKERQDQMIISAPPPEGYPSGIFSIQIHQITGLELEKLSKGDDSSDIQDEEREAGDSLPSAYCNVIINHRKVFKTRTKPQNAKPFYNAGTERFIADWQNAEVHIGVRDARTAWHCTPESCRAVQRTLAGERLLPSGWWCRLRTHASLDGLAQRTAPSTTRGYRLGDRNPGSEARDRGLRHSGRVEEPAPETQHQSWLGQNVPKQKSHWLVGAPPRSTLAGCGKTLQYMPFHPLPRQESLGRPQCGFRSFMAT